ATLTELLESPAVAGYLGGIVVTMLRQVASPLLRNAATLGGTLASTHPWSDVIPLFLALDAHVVVYAGQEQTTSLEDAMEQRGSLGRTIITHVILPATANDTVASFETFVRTEFDVGMLNCACRVTRHDGVCSDARIAFGGTPDIGRRIRSVEQALIGRQLTPDVIEAVATHAAEAIPAKDDLRASAAYRRVLAKAGVRRCLHRIANRGGE
ncbi:FAD binding domain-containing protein, partial [Candidatus Bipolaricaulota bacterium]|nr:FAD binding domain-containing protein [Candidatus Bipolaricaulota bacterium]